MKVFDKFEIGDIVVSINRCNSFRNAGDLFVVLEKSDRTALYYRLNTCSYHKNDWRLATYHEKQAYISGITNINQIKQENYELYPIY